MNDDIDEPLFTQDLTFDLSPNFTVTNEQEFNLTTHSIVDASDNSNLSSDINQLFIPPMTNPHSKKAKSSAALESRSINVELSENASLFKDCFYKIFTTKKKKFPKGLVIKIHNEICSSLNLIEVPREFQRNINLYFQAFSQYSNQILCFLQKNKQHILDVIPELRELK